MQWHIKTNEINVECSWDGIGWNISGWFDVQNFAWIWSNVFWSWILDLIKFVRFDICRQKCVIVLSFSCLTFAACQIGHFHFSSFTLIYQNCVIVLSFCCLTSAACQIGHFHFHTFTFKLSLSHFHFHTFTLSLSHFHFHTFTFALSHFHFRTSTLKLSRCLMFFWSLLMVLTTMVVLNLTRLFLVFKVYLYDAMMVELIIHISMLISRIHWEFTRIAEESMFQKVHFIRIWNAFQMRI